MRAVDRCDCSSLFVNHFLGYHSGNGETLKEKKSIQNEKADCLQGFFLGKRASQDAG